MHQRFLKMENKIKNERLNKYGPPGAHFYTNSGPGPFKLRKSNFFL